MLIRGPGRGGHARDLRQRSPGRAQAPGRGGLSARGPAVGAGSGGACAAAGGPAAASLEGRVRPGGALCSWRPRFARARACAPGPSPQPAGLPVVRAPPRRCGRSPVGWRSVPITRSNSSAWTRIRRGGLLQRQAGGFERLGLAAQRRAGFLEQVEDRLDRGEQRSDRRSPAGGAHRRRSPVRAPAGAGWRAATRRAAPRDPPPMWRRRSRSPSPASTRRAARDHLDQASGISPRRHDGSPRSRSPVWPVRAQSPPDVIVELRRHRIAPHAARCARC